MIRLFDCKIIVSIFQSYYFNFHYVSNDRGKVKYELRVTSSNSQITSSNLRVTSSDPRVTSSRPRVTSLNPRVRRLKPRAAILKSLFEAIKPRVI